MKCKYCETELEEGVTICPQCGEDNGATLSEVDEAVEQALSELEEVLEADEKEKPEKDEPATITVTPGKFATAIAVCVVLMAALVALVIGGLNEKQDAGTTTGSTENTAQNIQATTAPATTPADTGMDNVTCKGSYAATEEDLANSMDTVVATIGDKQLTNAELQVYYWMLVRQYYAENGYYALYYGLDITQPLSQQVCYYDNTLTWEQYFLQQALNSWYSYQALALDGQANGYVLEADYQQYLAELPETLAGAAEAQGFGSVEELLLYYIGPGAGIDEYMAYENLYYNGQAYYAAESQKYQPTAEEIEAYFNLHEAEYAELGLTKETKYVNVRHILILPDGATIDTIYSQTFSEEAWASAESKAQGILDQWKQGAATEESFASMANSYSADTGSNTAGGLYSDVYQGEMMETFDAWCFDPARQVGDTGLVKTAAGWHVMYYSGETVLWTSYAENDLRYEWQLAFMEQVKEDYPIEVNYEAIVLAQAGWIESE